jgi:DNA-binding transcriptional LysR family regulator
MISPLVDTRYLEAFLAVCEEGTLARAAVRIHKTQPAISYNLQRLEEAVGTRLFERSGRRLILTAAGRRLRELGEQHAAAFQRFRQEMDGAVLDAAPVRLATVSGFGRYVLYPRLRDLTRDASGPIVMLFRTAADVFRMVEEGDVDCGAVYHTKMSNRLQFTPVYDEELVLIAPTGMRPPGAGWRRLSTYSAVPFVTYEEAEYVFGRWFEAQFGRQPAGGIARWHVTELEEVIDAVGHGCGVSIVPRDAVQGAGTMISVIRPARRRCFNRVFRVNRVASPQPAILDRVFASLASQRPPALGAAAPLERTPKRRGRTHRP